MYTNSLRKFKHGNQPPWTKEQLLAGLLYYRELNGNFPTADEIDLFEYLPSARSIQRSHGGLVALRKQLIPKELSDHTKGEYRSTIAKVGDKRAVKYETDFFNFLINLFAEISIHEHKIIRPGGVECDFFIYLDSNDSTGIVIDLFYAKNLTTLLKIVSIKAKRYTLLKQKVLLILVGNKDLSTGEINKRLRNKTMPLPSNINVVTERYFKEVYLNELLEKSRFTIKK